MSRVIRISDEIFTKLQNLAEPLVDTPASVIEKLLNRHESINEKSQSKKVNIDTCGLFLAPADKSNIKQTIQQEVFSKDAFQYLNATEKENLKSILKQKEFFNCWAMSESNRSTFNKMQIGDYVLLSEKGTKKFNFLGKVSGKLESLSLGNHLWSFTPGKPWSLIYLLDDLKAVDINKQQMVQVLGYSPKDVVQKVRKVQRQNLVSALNNFGSIDLMINELNS